MGTKTSKPVQADGNNSNANSNNITIIETLEEHKNLTSIILILILIILILHGLVKIYSWNKESVKRAERLKSRINLNAV